jgi:hypothetical protein
VRQSEGHSGGTVPVLGLDSGLFKVHHPKGTEGTQKEFQST